MDPRLRVPAHPWHFREAHRVAALLEAGQVYANEYQTGAMIEAPFGGYKQSGYGREKGVEALHCYAQLKCVTVKLRLIAGQDLTQLAAENLLEPELREPRQPP